MNLNFENRQGTVEIEIDVEYDIIPAQKQTWDDPGFPAEAEITSWTISIPDDKRKPLRATRGDSIGDLAEYLSRVTGRDERTLADELAEQVLQYAADEAEGYAEDQAASRYEDRFERDDRW